MLKYQQVRLAANVLWTRRFIEADGDHDSNAAHIRAFNDWLAGNDAMDTVMLPIADGLTMARRR